ncbi:hypothetical protein M8818_000946 [Zalaria obscura]|uniref:Uncharacterized protein n=1 Tax=Zalaria obscura TaxID=2024903 RepID=A0ACC3SN80_9PEZI
MASMIVASGPAVPASNGVKSKPGSSDPIRRKARTFLGAGCGALARPTSSSFHSHPALLSPTRHRHLPILPSSTLPITFLCLACPPSDSDESKSNTTTIPRGTTGNMSNFHYGAPHYPSGLSSHASHSHNHHGRSRRGPRIASAQNAHRQQFKAQRSPKEIPQAPEYSAYVRDFEAAKSFEFEDDEIFCPFHLLTEDDLQSIHSSSSSDRSSLASGSPEASPLQHQVQPTPSFLVSAAPQNFNHTSYQHNAAQQMKLHQPMAQRTRNAIPIVDPSTRAVASPPPSISPARQMQQQYVGRRW